LSARAAAEWSSLEEAHLGLVVVVTGGRREVVEPGELLRGEDDGVSGDVLFETPDVLGTGDRGDVAVKRLDPP